MVRFARAFAPLRDVVNWPPLARGKTGCEHPSQGTPSCTLCKSVETSCEGKEDPMTGVPKLLAKIKTLCRKYSIG